MTGPQIAVFAVLALTMGAFLWGRFRHDGVAIAALLAATALGLVPPEDAFAGFGHPAVVTVACVLVLSHGLQSSGAVDALARAVLPQRAGRTAGLAALMGLGALLSGFMNNVGAMALLMPLAVQLAGRHGLAPGQVLMPLAFATILGGMTTLVGTPPNLIVAGFREDSGAGAFGMFAFTPVGLAVAVLGVAFVALAGWRLTPVRTPQSPEGFETGAYFTEVRVPEGAKAAGMTLHEVEAALGGGQVTGLVRNEVRLIAPHGGRRLRPGDIMVLEAEVETLAEALSALGITLEEEGSAADKAKAKEKAADAGGAEPDRPAPDSADPEADPDAPAADPSAAEDAPEDASADDDKGTDDKEADDTGADDTGADDTGADADPKPAASAPRRDDDVTLHEYAVLPGSILIGRSATDLRLRTRHGLNLLAVSRAGIPPRTRLRTLELRAGDLLLLQGQPEVMADFAADHGCVPLGDRDLRLPDRRRALLATGIMLAAVAAAATGLASAATAFAAGVLASMAAGTLQARKLYAAVDWPVVVLLAALIPVAGAMQDTGAAALLARVLTDTVAQGNAMAALAVVLVVTMLLSDVMNNAATAAVMCPVALGIAGTLGVNPDAFLMAVAIGASCAFLTPIGHQNNTLILGPGGFRFGDYWRMGLPLEAVVVAVALPLLPLVFPL